MIGWLLGAACEGAGSVVVAMASAVEAPPLYAVLSSWQLVALGAVASGNCERGRLDRLVVAESHMPHAGMWQPVQPACKP